MQWWMANHLHPVKHEIECKWVLTADLSCWIVDWVWNVSIKCNSGLLQRAWFINEKTILPLCGFAIVSIEEKNLLQLSCSRNNYIKMCQICSKILSSRYWTSYENQTFQDEFIMFPYFVSISLVTIWNKGCQPFLWNQIIQMTKIVFKKFHPHNGNEDNINYLRT